MTSTLRRGSQWRDSLRIGGATALRGLRYYRGTAVLLGFALLGSIIAIVPLSNLFGRGGDWLAFRPILRPVPGGDLGLPWLMHIAGPSAAQQEAVSRLGTLLLVTVWSAVLLGIVTVLTMGLARAAERRGERLIQRAVGASRRSLIAAAVMEIGILALPSLVGGSLVVVAVTRATVASWPGVLFSGTGALPVIATAVIALAFAAVLLIPAVLTPRRIAERDMDEALPVVPVVLQSALCFIVLTTGALLTHRAEELAPARGGPAANGMVLSISTPPVPAEERSIQLQSLLDVLHAAGMRSVSLTSPGTLTGVGHVAMVLTDCGQCRENGLSMSVRLKPATHEIVSADTFGLIGLPVLEGRGITAEDDWDSPRVAVVSRSLAGREFQDGKPLGRRIHTGDGDIEGATVVGVVDDRPPIGLGGTLQPRYAVYLSVLQHPPRMVDLLVRDPVDPRILAGTVAGTLGVGSAAGTVTTEGAVRESAMAPVQWFGRVFAAEGWALTALAGFGIIAYMKLWVESLAREIALRRSLGAPRSRILAWVLWKAFGVAAKSLAVGVWFGIAVWSALPELVTGTHAWGQAQLLRYALLISSLVLCGVLSPAWRFSRQRPAELLQRSI